MATARQAILVLGGGVVSRLAAITVAGGFNTDAGRAIYLGLTPQLGPNDPDVALAIVPGDEEPRWQGLKGQVAWPIEIQAVAKDDLDDPWTLVEALLEDIKRAMETPDRKIAGWDMTRGRTRTLEREAGTTVVGAGITYVVAYAETWGHP
jgi:hypothetical protein